jgi:hypothetical protein
VRNSIARKGGGGGGGKFLSKKRATCPRAALAVMGPSSQLAAGLLRRLYIPPCNGKASHQEELST